MVILQESSVMFDFSLLLQMNQYPLFLFELSGVYKYHISYVFQHMDMILLFLFVYLLTNNYSSELFIKV